MNLEPLKRGRSVPLREDLRAALITTADMPEIIEMLNTPAVTEYLFFAPSPDEVYEGYFRPIIENTGKAVREGTWPESPTIVIRDHEGGFMGMCGVDAVSLHPGNYEIGFQLPVHAWKKGIATAACRMMTALAFEMLGAHKVAADCYAGNAGSRRVLEKCGYRREGIQEKYYKLDSGFDDRVLYGMTAGRYERSKT